MKKNLTPSCIPSVIPSYHHITISHARALKSLEKINEDHSCAKDTNKRTTLTILQLKILAIKKCFILLPTYKNISVEKNSAERNAQS